MRLVHDLRSSLMVDYSFTPAKSDKQFKRAMEAQARFTAKLECAPGGEPVIQVGIC